MNKTELWKKRIIYSKENWKLLIHLLLGTYRFGVNNLWWNDYDSMFGVPWYKKTPKKIIANYRGAKFRAMGCYFVSEETAGFLWPNRRKKKQ